MNSSIKNFSFVFILFGIALAFILGAVSLTFSRNDNHIPPTLTIPPYNSELPNLQELVLQITAIPYTPDLTKIIKPNPIVETLALALPTNLPTPIRMTLPPPTVLTIDDSNLKGESVEFSKIGLSLEVPAGWTIDHPPSLLTGDFSGVTVSIHNYMLAKDVATALANGDYDLKASANPIWADVYSMDIFFDKSYLSQYNYSIQTWADNPYLFSPQTEIISKEKVVVGGIEGYRFVIAGTLNGVRVVKGQVGFGRGDGIYIFAYPLNTDEQKAMSDFILNSIQFLEIK
jgi:hypothetical protein